MKIDLFKQRYLVMGLGISGFNVAKYLIERGVSVYVNDISDSDMIVERISLLEKLSRERGGEFKYFLSTHDNYEMLEGVNIILLSPGISPQLKVLEDARKRGILITNDIQLFYWIYGGDLIAVTGSNGKSTTVSMISYILNHCGRKSIAAGNIGKGVFELGEEDVKENIIVLELSSFQLETMIDFRPKYGVLLNITPDHLDRHVSFEKYAMAKLNLFKNQKSEDFAVVNDEVSFREFFEGINSQVYGFRRDKPLKNFKRGIYLLNNKIIKRNGNSESPVLSLNDFPLEGPHNMENFLASFMVLSIMGIGHEEIVNGIKGFKSLPHRMEFLGEINGVKFFNDSKATNVDSAVMAVKSFENGVHLILGGRDKKTDLSPLFEAMEGRVKYVYLIGEAAERFSRDMGDRFKKIMVGSLKEAVIKAFSISKKGDVILLSPACASFDMFENFMHRGEEFKKIFMELKGRVENG